MTSENRLTGLGERFSGAFFTKGRTMTPLEACLLILRAFIAGLGGGKRRKR